MDTFRIFYSWQADRSGELCRHFIDKALRAAAITVSSAIGITVEIDSDTQGEPGTPPITDTILRKIRECDAFVGDMTFVAETEAGKLMPNPNVMGEYGYALSEKSTRRILLAMNTAFGPPDKLPFDLGHLRHPITFDAPLGIANGARRAARDAFAHKLEEPLKLLIEHARADAAREKANEPRAASAAHEFVESLISATEIGFKPAIVSKPKVILHLAPFAAYAGHRLDIREAKRVTSDLSPIHLSASASGLDENEWWVRGKGAIVPGRPNEETTWYARLVRPGVFEVSLNIGQKIDDDPRALVDGYHVEAAMVDMFDQCAGAAAELGFSGPGLVSAVLIIAEDVDVIMGRSSGRFRKPFVLLERLEIAEIGSRVGDHLQPMFDRLWTAAGISTGSVSFQNGGWAGYRGERSYDL